jgi:outer membrane PBP1 activator LpoA protein
MSVPGSRRTAVFRLAAAFLAASAYVPLNPTSGHASERENAGFASTYARLLKARDLWESGFRQAGQAREDRQLQAIELLLAPDTLDQAQAYLDSLIEHRMNDKGLLGRRDIARAAIALYEHRPHETLRLLPPADQVPRRHGLRIMELTARAQLGQGDTLESVSTRVLLAKHLSRPADIADNETAIWQAMESLNREELAQMAARTQDANLRGWLELAAIERTSSQDERLDLSRKDWEQRHPDHPGRKRYLAPTVLPAPLPAGEMGRVDQRP